MEIFVHSYLQFLAVGCSNFDPASIYSVKRFSGKARCLFTCHNIKCINNFQQTLLDQEHVLLKWHVLINQSQVEVQTQIFVWSDFPDRNYLWSDFPGGNSTWSDFPSRPKLPLIRLFRTEVFWSDHLQTIVQTQIQTIAQTLIRLRSDSIVLEIVWSAEDFTYEQIS